MNPAPRLPYRPEIDGLRAIAVGAVMLFHAQLPGLSGGFAGVDIFFVISGYLITRQLIDSAAAAPALLRDFYVRRARRLLPALLLVLTVASVAALVLLPPLQLSAYAASLVAGLIFAANIHFARTPEGYFDTELADPPLLHLWSLAVEEQFYLLFPLLVLLLGRRGRKLWFGLAAAGLFSLLISIRWAETDAVNAFFQLPSRGWELMAGALIVPIERRGMAERAALPLACAGMIAILASFAILGPATRWPGLPAIIPVLGTAAIILAGDRAGFVGRMLAWPPLVQFGLWSYGAYLWHHALLALFRAGLSDWSLARALLILMLSIVLAGLTFRFVEQPLRARDRSAWRDGVAALAIIGVLLGGAFGMRASHGWPQRFAAATLAPITSSRIDLDQSVRCMAPADGTIRPDWPCTRGDGPTRVAILGDSHAAALAPGFDPWLNRRGASMEMLVMAGCAPVVDDALPNTRPPCRTFMRTMQHRVVSDRAIDTVVIAGRWTPKLVLAGFDNGEGGREGTPYDVRPLARPAAVTHGLRAMIAPLLRAGKRVILVYPVPEAGWHVPRTVFKQRLRGDTTDLSIDAALYSTRNSLAIAALDAVGTHPALTRAYPARGLCPVTRCLLSVGGTPLYFDADHLTAAGALRAVGDIATKDPT